MAQNAPDPSLVDTGGVVGVPGTEKHPRGKDTSAGSKDKKTTTTAPAKNKGGRPSKQPDALKHKPGGAAETDPHKLRKQRETAYTHRPKRKTGAEIKADAREVRRKERFLEKGY